ncbi:succinylglutamate-semialdehyde dehydrogenase [bacterium]|nr:succinylglutamate-semialdehyde dehydrogenase [bacterium]
MKTSKQYFDGPLKEGRVVSYNPVTKDVLFDVEKSTSGDIERVLKKAKSVLSKWSQLPVSERMAYLSSFQKKLIENKSKLSELIAKETGKPLWESLTEVSAMVNKIDITFKSFENRCPDLTIQTKDTLTTTRYKSLGIVVVLGPFNFPGHLPNGHIIPALLMGNVVVFKPSELTPAVGNMMVDLWIEAGLPDGVLSICFGESEEGRYLVEHPDVTGVFFTGSSTTGEKIQKSIIGHPYKLAALEMGGNNSLIIESFENQSAAVLTAIQSAFMTAGQRCTCARRLVLVRSKETLSFVEQFVEATRIMKIGAYNTDSFIGSVISDLSYKNILNSVDDLVKRGSNSILNTQDMEPPFVRPVILDSTDVDRGDEEIFGPVTQIIWVSSVEEAMSVCNESTYGLSTSILAKSKWSYDKVFNGIRSGLIHWNMPTNGASSYAPFGGVGRSGNYRPSAYFAIDYCGYPVSTILRSTLEFPDSLPIGLTI